MRPRINNENKRKKRVCLYLTKNEFEELQEMKKNGGYENINNMLRSKIFN